MQLECSRELSMQSVLITQDHHSSIRLLKRKQLFPKLPQQEYFYEWTRQDHLQFSCSFHLFIGCYRRMPHKCLRRLDTRMINFDIKSQLYIQRVSPSGHERYHHINTYISASAPQNNDPNRRPAK